MRLLQPLADGAKWKRRRSMEENTKRDLTFAEVIEAARRVDQYSSRLAGRCALIMDNKEASIFSTMNEESPTRSTVSGRGPS